MVSLVQVASVHLMLQIQQRDSAGNGIRIDGGGHDGEKLYSINPTDDIRDVLTFVEEEKKTPGEWNIYISQRPRIVYVLGS